MKFSKYFIPILVIFIFTSCSEKGSQNFKRAEAFQITGEFEKSIQEYKLAIELNPTQSKYYFGLAQVYEIQDSLNNAAKLYDQAIKLSPDSSRYISRYNFIKGKILFNENDFENALSYLVKSQVSIKDSFIAVIKENLIAEAIKLYKNGNSKRSERILLDIIDCGISDENVFYELSKVYLRQGNLEKRIEFLKKAISQNPTNSLYHYELGKQYYNASKYNLAVEEFEKSGSYKNSKNLLRLSKIKYEQQLSTEADNNYPKGKTGTTSSSSFSSNWFQGGNLHNATVAQWKNATYQNKLATAGDWLAATLWKGYLNSPDDFDKAKVKAQILVNAVDRVVAKNKIESLHVNEIAASIITMSNDLGPF